MLHKGGGYETVFGLLVIGGHSVAMALIERQTKTALLESLTVAGCVVIFVGLYAFIKFMEKRGE